MGLVTSETVGRVGRTAIMCGLLLTVLSKSMPSSSTEAVFSQFSCGSIINVTQEGSLHGAEILHEVLLDQVFRSLIRINENGEFLGSASLVLLNCHGQVGIVTARHVLDDIENSVEFKFPYIEESFISSLSPERFFPIGGQNYSEIGRTYDQEFLAVLSQEELAMLSSLGVVPLFPSREEFKYAGFVKIVGEEFVFIPYRVESKKGGVLRLAPVNPKSHSDIAEGGMSGSALIPGIFINGEFYPTGASMLGFLVGGNSGGIAPCPQGECLAETRGNSRVEAFVTQIQLP